MSVLDRQGFYRDFIRQRSLNKNCDNLFQESYLVAKVIPLCNEVQRKVKQHMMKTYYMKTYGMV